MKFPIVLIIGVVYVFTAWYFRVPLEATILFAVAGCIGGYVCGYLEGSKR